MLTYTETYTHTHAHTHTYTCTYTQKDSHWVVNAHSNTYTQMPAHTFASAHSANSWRPAAAGKQCVPPPSLPPPLAALVGLIPVMCPGFPPVPPRVCACACFAVGLFFH